MAKIKFGMMMTDARGKLGGQVFSKNRSGAFVRTKVTPTNPRTLAQMLSRSILASVSSAWAELTIAQRASFNGAVEDWQKTDIFGDLKKPSGKNLHSGLSKNRLQIGQSALLTAPSKVEIPFLGITAVEVSLADVDVVIDGAVIPVGFVAQVSSTGALSAGTSYTDGKYRVIGYQSAGAYDSAQIYADYLAKFGTPAVGQNVYFQVKLIAVASGQAGVPERVKAVISA